MRIFFSIIFLIFVETVSAQHDTNMQQNLLLTTDKTQYQNSETIWIKSYLTTNSGDFDTICHQINVQLLLPDNSVAYSQIHKLKNGCSQGQITLPDSASDGHYMLRAYANAMRNFGDSTLFQKPIFIENPNKIFYTEAYFADVKREMRLRKSNQKHNKTPKYLSDTISETDIFSIQLREQRDSVQLKIVPKSGLNEQLNLSLSITQNKEIESKSCYAVSSKKFQAKVTKYYYYPENSLSVSGTVKKLVLDLPAENATVQMFVLNEHYKKLTTETDSLGRFYFNGLDYPDTMELKVESYSASGKLAFIVNIDEPDYPMTRRIFTEYLEEEFYWLKVGRKQARERYQYEPQQDTSSTGRIHYSVNQVIYFDKINVSGYASTLAVIALYVHGISIFGESALRGKSSFSLSSEPLYLLDDVSVAKSTIESLPPEQVERVEIVKGNNAAIYGSRAANGVIAVYTKQGYNIQIGHVTFKQIGYHTAQEFSRAENIQNHTLLWMPNVKFDENNCATVNIPKSDSGIYYVLLQGFIGNKFVRQSFITD